MVSFKWPYSFDVLVNVCTCTCIRIHTLTQSSHADQGEATWREAVVMFDTAPSSVTIRGVRGGASRAEPFGDIAIDDIQVCRCADVGV